MPWSKPRPGIKRGPKSFSGTRRKRCDLRVPPVQPVQPVRHITRYSRKRKIDVLTWLVNHRVADISKNEFGEPPTPCLKSGQKPIPEEQLQELRQCKDHTIYRPATYREAEKYWNIQGTLIALWWQRREKYLPPAEIEKSKYYMIQSSPNKKFKPPSQEKSVAQNSIEPPTLQPASNAATQSPTSVAQPKQAAVEISDDSGSDSDGFIGDDDEESPDIQPAIANTRNTGDDQMSKDIQELQQIFDDSDTDLMLNTNKGASTDPQGQQDNEESEDTEGSEDPELFGSI
ncbi:hypothetical protein F4805DRAFT_140448 [Annulohypoxylon moriforme]|nr:hypothetical protein F4805DRAFT_140448 [Annulohypoxylon moriforme]